MTEILGILLVAGGILGGGFFYAASIRAEVVNMEAFLRLARHIRSRIACFRQPLAAIYADFSDPALDRCHFMEELQKGSFLPALEKKKDMLGLRPELIHLLSDFGSELGKSGAEDQIRHCDRCIAEMETALTALKAAYPDRVRLARSLALCFAAMAALLLL